MTKIKLDDNDSCLIVRKDNKIEVLLPSSEMNDEKEMSESTLFLSAVAYLSQDSKFIKNIIKKFYKVIENTK